MTSHNHRDEGDGHPLWEAAWLCLHAFSGRHVVGPGCGGAFVPLSHVQGRNVPFALLWPRGTVFPSAEGPWLAHFTLSMWFSKPDRLGTCVSKSLPDLHTDTFLLSRWGRSSPMWSWHGASPGFEPRRSLQDVFHFETLPRLCNL